MKSKIIEPARQSVNVLFGDLIRRLKSAPHSTCPVELASSFIKMCAAESCGKCIPCRIGLDKVSGLLDKILDGKGTKEDIDLLEKTARVIADSADCVIGSEAAGSLLTALNGFREDFLSHIERNRCSASFIPVPCRQACPADVDIPGYVSLCGQGRYADAVRLIRKDNPFPSVCALVCEHPCEKNCRRAFVDAPVNIRGIKEYVVTKAGKVPVPEKLPSTGKTVAIIGGGPSGLTAAYYLSLFGHKVTVFEKREKLGGMLRYGIPYYRLPAEMLDYDIDAILSLGIEVKCSSDIGKTVRIGDLEKQYDAVYLSIGAHSDNKLDIPGEDAKNVISAVELLRDMGDYKHPDFAGKKVVIVGGGNVAMDVTRTAIRLGAQSVTCVYRRRIEDMTARAEEVEGAVAEGAFIRPLLAPVAINVDKEGKAIGLTVQPQIVGAYDRGRPKPCKANRVQECIPADYIIVAIGQAVDSKVFVSDGYAVKRGVFLTTDENYIDKKVFAGGDCASGPATVIKVIEAGKVAAKNINTYLGFDTELKVDIDIPPAQPSYMPPCGRVNVSEREAQQRKNDFDWIEVPLSDEEAKQECARCLRCDCYGYGSFRGGRKTTW